MSLNHRAETVLEQLIQTYIQGGQPVGSTTLSKLPEVDVSAATIRNVMSELEELGLIKAPHTSAGRVPTSLGYRMFVNRLVQSKPLNAQTVQALSNTFSGQQDSSEALSQASELVSELTQFAGVIVLPNQSASRFHQLEFLRLSDTRILVILVTEDGRVQNRILPMTHTFSESELVEAANFFNRRYKGDTLEEVRIKIIEDMRQDNDEMHRINQAAIVAASSLITSEDNEVKSEMLVSGEQRLLDIPDLRDIDTLQKLFDAFKAKRDLLTLLDRSMKASGVSVFIGEESGYSALGECSVVASPYEVDGEIIGTLGVIGPTRMAYNNVISVVDVTAKLLGQSLTKGAKS